MVMRPSAVVSAWDLMLMIFNWLGKSRMGSACERHATMASSKSTRLSPECIALLSAFQTFLFTHCKVNERTAALYLGGLRRAYPLIGPNPSHQDIEAYITLMRTDGNASNNYASF